MGSSVSYEALSQLDEEERMSDEGSRRGTAGGSSNGSTRPGSSDHEQWIMGGESKVWGYQKTKWGSFVYYTIFITTFGLFAIFCRWFPRVKVYIYAKKAPLWNCNIVVVGEEKEKGSKSRDFMVCSVIRQPGHDMPEKYTEKTLGQLSHSTSKTYLLELGVNGDVYTRVHRYFIYKYHKYYWNPELCRFEHLDGLGSVKCSQFLGELGSGLSENRRCEEMSVHGKNKISLEEKNCLKLLVEEVLHPFYVFQILSVILWSIDEYIYYAVCVTVLSLLSITLALREMMKQMKSLQAMAENSEAALVTVRLATGVEKQISSSELVPGDVLLIPQEGEFKMPCDGVLICGRVLVDEAMLTGESTFMQKSAMDKSRMNETYDAEAHRNHTLFCGTTVMQTRYYRGEKVACVVTKTGFNTVKGDLIHSILFPKEVGFQFYVDSIIFIVILFALALLGMSFCLVIYIERGTSWQITVLRVLDIVTIVVPPALPAAMTVGIVYAQSRLKKNRIYCTSPPRINFCGKLKHMCFDKTGTLTEDALDLWCVVPVKLPQAKVLLVADAPRPHSLATMTNLKSDVKLHSRNVEQRQQEPEFLDAVGDPSTLEDNSSLLHGLASCHSVTYLNKKFAGDPLEIKMFMATGYSLEDPSQQAEVKETSNYDTLCPSVVKKGSMELGIVRTFDFSSNLQRMSVVVRPLGTEDNSMMLYCKGAPEKIKNLCDPSTIPNNFDKVLDSFTVRGYRVIAFGRKTLVDLKWHQIQRIKRESVECDLEFNGFLVMQNNLKPATIPVIKELREADIQMVMVTGDHLSTAISVARDAGMILPGDKILRVEVNGNSGELEFILQAHYYEKDSEDDRRMNLRGAPERYNLTSMNNNISSAEDPVFVNVQHVNTSSSGECHTLVPISSRRTSSCSESEVGIHLDGLLPVSVIKATGCLSKDCIINLEDTNYHFVMAGDVWQRLDKATTLEIKRRILVKGTIFARMSPDNKAELIDCLQQLGYVVGMCGDGANDCGALKTAHVGISLSMAEASVASPFTSKIPDISCVPALIREGRCALVTSFGVFKYMALYSLVQFMAVILLYMHWSNFSDKQYLYFDLGITTTVAIVMGRTDPYPRLVPLRPVGSLVSFSNIFSIISQVVVAGMIQVIGLFYLSLQPWFEPAKPATADDLATHCWETTTLFSITIFQYLTLAFVFSKGPPFRKKFYTNYAFVLALVILLALNVWLAVKPLPPFVGSLMDLMEVQPESAKFRLWILTLPGLHFGLSLFLEQPWAHKVMKTLENKCKRKRNKQPYKDILKGLQKDLSWPVVKR